MSTIKLFLISLLIGGSIGLGLFALSRPSDSGIVMISPANKPLDVYEHVHANKISVRNFFVENVVKNKPVNIVGKTTTTQFVAYSKVYGCRGCKIEHVWYLGNDIVESKTNTLSSNRSGFWTTVPSNEFGVWMVEININNTWIDTLVVTRKAKPSIEKQVAEGQQQECSFMVQRLTQQLHDTPGDEYYEFMLHQWKTRCK